MPARSLRAARGNVMRTALSVALGASLLVACSAAQPSSSTPADGASIQASSPSPSPSVPAVSPSTPASPTPAAPYASSSGGDFSWGDPVVMTGVVNLWPERPKLVHANGIFVLLEQSRVFVSTDATAWSPAGLPVGEEPTFELNGLVAGGPGFVIVGTENIDADDDGSPEESEAVVLTSSDGREWRRLTDFRFAHSSMNQVARSRQGLVVFGFTRNAGASIWTSVDGVAWLKATNETGLEVAAGIQLVAEHDGRLTAFVGRPGVDALDTGRVDVWETEGRADWLKVGSLPEEDAIVHRATFGAGRWLAVGFVPPDDGTEGPDAWTSPDGRTWTRTTAPVEAHTAIAGWADGMIAASHTGSSPGETCAGPGPFIGRSRISMGGGDWVVVPPSDGAAASALFVVDDQILAIGLSVRPDGEVVPVRWLASLPRSVAVPAPTPTPTPRPSSDGCGG